MNNLTVSLLGFPMVNQELSVDVVNPVTRETVRTVTPFLDGTVRIPKIDPGAYELRVKHPNLSVPVIQRPIHVLPIGDTNITLLLDPSKFRNTPIADIPEANLTPVADLSASTAETVAPLAAKTPGEAIRSADWNTLAGAVRDLANANVQLTQLVTPVGHDHVELNAKIEEMSNNFATLLDTMSQALAELQRQIQSLRLRKQLDDVFDGPLSTIPLPKRNELFQLVDDLDLKVNDSPTSFAKAQRAAATQISAKLDTLIDEQSATDPDVAAAPTIGKVNEAVNLLKNNRATNYSSEISFNRTVDRAVGGGALTAFRK